MTRRCKKNPQKLTHYNDCTLVVQNHPFPFETVSAFPNNVTDSFVERVGERDVDHEPILEKGVRSDALCTVDDLVGDDKVSRLDLLRQTPRRAEGDDTPDPELAEGGDVCSHRDFRRVELVVGAVSGQKGHGDGFPGRRGRVFQNRDGGRRSTPRGLDVQDRRLVEVWEVVETSAADDGDVDLACQTPKRRKRSVREIDTNTERERKKPGST